MDSKSTSFNSILSINLYYQTAMAFALAEVTSDGDFDELIRLLWRAYSAEPRVTPLPLTFPADDDSAAAREKQVAQCQAAMMHMHRSDPTSQWLKVTNVATGKIIAGCRWHIHEKDPYSNAPDKPFSIPFWPEGDRKKYAEKVVGAIVQPRKARYRKPHLSIASSVSLLLLIQTSTVINEQNLRSPGYLH